MKSRNWFVGVALIVVGVVALLDSLGVIAFSWAVMRHLWPMLLVLVGIAVLPLKDWLKTLLLLVALAAGVLLYQHEAKVIAEKRSFSGWVSRTRHNLRSWSFGD